MEPDSRFFVAIPGTLKLAPNLADPTKSSILSEALLDPHISPEQSGWPPASDKNEDPVSHLRRMKEELAKSPSVSAGAKEESGASPVGNVPKYEERRKSPRLRCSGSAEFRIEGNDTRIWGTLTDISLHGCYVEMSSTFPVETKVVLVLKSCGIRIHLPGKVRVMYPALGMGICFAEIEPLQHQHLKQLLAFLTRRGAASTGRPVAEIQVKDPDVVQEVLRSVDPRAFLAEIVAFFQKNPLLSRNEFYEIAKGIRRF